jgi:hypothetical protein
MGSVKRSLRSVKTVGALADRRRARTSAGALMELAGMANERKRLELEMDRLRRRGAEIDVRLAEIADKERRLYAFVKEPPPDYVSGPTTSGAKSQPLPASVSRDDNYGPRLKPTELSY